MKLSVTHNTAKIAARLRGADKPLLKKVEGALGRGAQEIARLAREKVPKAFSTLTNAIRTYKLSDLVREILADTNYARAVEEGTGPGGLPPIQSIEDWMQVKGIEGDPFLIAAGIAKKGTKAQPFMQPAYKAKIPRINQLVTNALNKALAGV